MKLLKRRLLPLLALLLVAAGAALPYTVSLWQDSAVEQARENRLLNEVSLTLQKGADVRDVLCLLAGSTSDVGWPGTTRLTPEEASEAAKEAFRAMQESGLVQPVSEEQQDYDDASIYLEPHMVISMDESRLSAVIWLCWLEETPYNWIFIDDETGKMVRAFLNETDGTPFTGLQASSGSQDQDGNVRFAKQWGKFLSGYYGMDLRLDEAEIHGDDFSTYCKLYFDRGPRQEQGMVRLEIHGTAVYFND